MSEFLAGGTSAMEAARQALNHAVALGTSATGPAGETMAYDPGSVSLRAPLPTPSSLRDFIAFEAHIAATSKRRGQPIPPEWYKAPVYYKGEPSDDHRTGPPTSLAVEHAQVGLRTRVGLHHRAPRHQHH